ncbi:hypothetical protein HDE68_004947 [Pedobacter cryoconitis]|uniref:Uncharacterized protein n=1 Tax=Pedobacter cryoconitis TaxID=188932 RepID=A0A7W9E269_9SPHI|nr:hypothetical protein [Pedobacter cryoconitis]MBB5639009.1 hypothetical protein [Pedobacter cryoconitis]
MKFFLKIALIVPFVFVYIGFNSFTLNDDLKDFKAIHITSTWEVPQKTGEHMTFTRSPDLIYSNNYTISREPYEVTNTYVKINNSGQEVPDPMRPATLEIRYRYCISKKGQKNGICYNSISDSTGKIYPLDSLIKDFLHFPSLFYYGRGKGKDSIKVIKDYKNGYLTEIITNRKMSERDPDSSYFYFRKKPLDYSFLIKDKRSDNMYLYKALIIFNHIPKADLINNVSEKKTKFKHSFELKEVDVPDKENLKILIEKFKRSSEGK